MKKFLLISILLTGCVGIPVTENTGAGGVVVSVDSTGVILNQQGYNLWLKEGVPASYFTVVQNGYHVTNFYWHQANIIRGVK